MLTKVAKLLIILNLITLSQCEKKRFDLQFHAYICTILSKPMAKFECEFQKAAISHYVFSERVMFEKNMAKNFQVRIFVDVIQQLRQRSIHFLDIKLNVCDSLRSAYENQLIKFLFVELRRTSNIPFQCPFKGNFVYKFQNFSFTDKFLPSFTPLVNFTFGLDFYESGKLLGTTRILGSTVAKSKIN